MFPAIVLPVTGCLQGRVEEMDLWPTACLDLHIQLPAALCGPGASQVSLRLYVQKCASRFFTLTLNKLTLSALLQLPAGSEDPSSTSPPHLHILITKALPWPFAA